MPLNSRYGTSTPDGKTVPGQKRIDRLAAQAAALAATRPTPSTGESREPAEVGPPPSGEGGPEATAGSPSASSASSPSAPSSGSSSTPTAEASAGSGASAAMPEPAAAAGATILTRPIDAIRTSPFQPKGRPSAAAVDAVRQAIAEAGSLAALTSREGAPIFARLGPEAARLAELAYSIAEHGVKDPVEVRVAEDGAEECISGHRRLAAARLAGLTSVPVLSRGALSSAQAAAMVLNGNLHRENFTAWQEAVLVSQVQERRRADGVPADVRTLGSVMGWSSGKVHHLLRARSLFSPAALERIGGGAAAQVEEGLARLQPAELKRLVDLADEEERVAATRRAVGIAAPSQAPAPADRPVYSHRPKRGGGFVVEVHAPVEELGAGDAAVVYQVLATQLARVRSRLEVLGHPVQRGGE
jgi:ParB family transcriptional regulator, chromosome partitioning protein